MRRVWVNLNRKSWFGLKAGTGDHEAIRRFRLRWTAFSEEVVALSQRVDDNAFHLPAVGHLFSWRAVASAEPMGYRLVETDCYSHIAAQSLYLVARITPYAPFVVSRCQRRADGRSCS